MSGWIARLAPFLLTGVSLAAAAQTAAPSAAQRERPVAPTGLALLPMPASIVRGAGEVTIGAGAGVAAADPRANAAAELLIAHVRSNRGIDLTASPGGRAAIRFERDRALAGERYRLVSTPQGIRIAAATPAGFVNGAMTLAQLLSPDDATGQPVRVPALSIDDQPRFAWRGFMLDPARHFIPLPEVKRFVDQMAAVKLNTLHFHLADDQGWRFEVKRYPKLTEIGAWRTPPSTGAVPQGRYGGFYTQAELRALVAYAAARGITIVPEIDLPGHSKALVASYPEMGVFGDRPPVGNNWGVEPYLMNPSPAGMAFVKNVLDELIDVFPGTFIHVGGDEAVKQQWERSPAIQARIKALGLKDEEALQGWVIVELGKHLAKRGRRLIGWDEILEGNVPTSASVMSWRGEKGAIEAANAGHDVVLSPAPILYFDNLQSDRGDEIAGRATNQSLEKVYAYDPLPGAIAADKVRHVLGAQANGWSEYLVTPQQMQHAFFPRIGALAENTWYGGARDFAGFVTRLQPQVARWRRAGIAVADSAFAVNYTLDTARGEALRQARATVRLDTQVPAGTIRFTLDGTAPTAGSKAYAEPLTVRAGTTIRAAAFSAEGAPLAAVRDFSTARPALLTRRSAELVGCAGDTLWARVPLDADSPSDAGRFALSILNTCSADPAVPMDVATGFTVDVVRLPRNWALVGDGGKLIWRYNVTPHGELLLLAGCPLTKPADHAKDAARPIVVGSFPMPDPQTAPQRMRFSGRIPKLSGDMAVCMEFTTPLSDPFYAVERIQFTEDR